MYLILVTSYPQPSTLVLPLFDLAHTDGFSQFVSGVAGDSSLLALVPQHCVEVSRILVEEEMTTAKDISIS